MLPTSHPAASTGVSGYLAMKISHMGSVVPALFLRVSRPTPGPDCLPRHVTHPRPCQHDRLTARAARFTREGSLLRSSSAATAAKIAARLHPWMAAWTLADSAYLLQAV